MEETTAITGKDKILQFPSDQNLEIVAKGFLAALWMCQDQERVRDALDTPLEVFTTQNLRRFFEVSREVFLKYGELDEILISSKLQEGNESDQYLADQVPKIAQLVDTPNQIENYRCKLVEAWEGRELIRDTRRAEEALLNRDTEDFWLILEALLKRRTTNDSLPPIKKAVEWIGEDMPEPYPLLENLIYREGVYSLQAPAKSFKSFSALQLSVSLASGTPFWGLRTTPCRVLYINLEIGEKFFRDRFQIICKAMKKTPEELDMIFWNLRGSNVSLDDISPYRLKSEAPDLIVVDPLYQLATGLNENDVGEMGELLKKLDAIVKVTGSALLYVHHYAKGNASGKSVQDRGAGSGVLARHYDAGIYFTKHKEEDHFVVQTVSRNTPPLKDFVIRHEHPLTEVVPDANPRELEKRPGGQPKKTKEDILSILERDVWYTVVEIQKLAQKAKIGRTTFYNIWSSKLKFSRSIKHREEGKSMKYQLA